MYKIFIVFLFVLTSCTSNEATNSKEKVSQAKIVAKEKKRNTPDVKLNLETKGTLRIGDELQFKFSSKYKTDPDSIVCLLNKNTLKGAIDNGKSFSIMANTLPTGKQKIGFNFFWGDSIVETRFVNISLLSNIKPDQYTYKVIKHFPHDITFYTQGLEFADGFLYEGTGQTGESTLSKIDLDKHEIIQQISLPNNVFGEGITILNDKIYQLTWQSQRGFVYEKESLRKLYEFSYPTEGWGLCNDGKALIMSDGSENIYFLDTEFMQETHRIQVYDDKGAITRLNELEYINGIIYANIYGSDDIVAFEAETGRVLKRINLAGLLDKAKLSHSVDVLNGIAWDYVNKRMIVTGKWWPSLFEIEFIKK